MITFLAWLTVVLPFFLIPLLLWWLIKKIPSETSTDYAHTAPPAGQIEPTVTMTTTAQPQWTSIDEESFLREDPPEQKPVAAGIRVWRVYRSIDQQTWAECDPALTERAACNYATYIKRNNADEYVRVNDPEGMIVYYD